MIDAANTPDQQLNQQQNLLTSPWLLPQSFDETFTAAQQHIVEQHQHILQQHLLLDAKMQNFFAVIQQQHDNRSQHISPAPPKPIPPFAAIYLCSKIY